MMGSALLHTSALSVGYKRSLLQDVEMELKAGEMVSLIGSNGSGKSTLLRTLSGIMRPIAGRVLHNGQDVGELSAEQRARTIAVVNSERPMVGQMEVRMMVGLGRQPWSGYFGRLTGVDIDAVNDAMNKTGVTEHALKSVGEISDGERQKVMVARALAQATPVLLLDEPTAFLDLKNKVKMMDLLGVIARGTDRGVLISTHDLQLALDLSDRLFLIKQSGELWIGTPDEAIGSNVLEDEFADDRISFDRSSRSFKLK